MLLPILPFTLDALLLEKDQGIDDAPDGAVFTVFLPVFVHLVVFFLASLIMVQKRHVFDVLLGAVDFAFWQRETGVCIIVIGSTLHGHSHLWNWSLSLNALDTHVGTHSESLRSDRGGYEGRGFAVYGCQSLLVHFMVDIYLENLLFEILFI